MRLACTRRRCVNRALAFATLGGATVLAVASSQVELAVLSGPSFAQSEPSLDIKKQKKPARPVAAVAAAPTSAASPVPAETVAAPAAEAVAPAAVEAKPAATAAAPAQVAADFQVFQQLQAAGVRTCLQLADGMGRFQMTGVTQYAAASTWNKNDPDKRLVASLIGQRFGQEATSPVGMSGVISSPGATGKCDAVGIQVLPTTSACSTVQTQVLAKGEQLGTLAGVPLLRNAQNLRVMLLPTAGNGCVIVGMNNFYSE